MTKSKLPARPSLESLRKQAKKLAHAIAGGDAGAIDRARAQLPNAKLPLSQRDAQLVLAREYGFRGWQDLLKEVQERLGGGLEWAVSQARRRIHDNDVEGLRQLLAEYPALLSRSELLEMATGSFGDSFDPAREQIFTRAACAELLIDAGAVVAPSVCEHLIRDRARGLLALFHRRGLLPRSLKFFAALGDIEGVRASLVANRDELAAVNEAFQCACHLEQATVAELLLDRSIALDAELGRRIDGGPGRPAFVRFIIENLLTFTHADPDGPWQAFVMRQVVRAVNDGDLASFVDGLRREAWMLGETCVKFQAGLIERAVMRDRPEFITALLELDPAVLHSPVPPPSQSFEFAFTYAKTTCFRCCCASGRLPDDLPHAAGNGDFARVQTLVRRGGQACAGRPRESFSRQQRLHPREPAMGRAQRAAGSRHRARLGGHQQPVRDRRLSSRARGRYQHELELP